MMASQALQLSEAVSKSWICMHNKDLQKSRIDKLQGVGRLTLQTHENRTRAHPPLDI